MHMTAHLDGEIRDGRHTMQVRVFYEDTDFSGVVYHASYLRFMERGRTNYLRLIGANHREMFDQSGKDAVAFVVRSMNVDWLKPARMDDVLDIVTWPQTIKGASAVLRQECRRGAELLCGATVRFAIVAGGRARPMPDALREAMQTDWDRQTTT